MIPLQSKSSAWAVAGVVAALCTGCLQGSSPQSSGSPTTYATATFVDDYRIEVQLVHNHEFLAEYRKLLTIHRGDRLIAEREYQDPGGFAAMYIARHGERLNVFDGLSRGIELDMQAGTVTELVGNMSEVELSYIGRFMFSENPTHDYRWIESKEPVHWTPLGSSSR